MTYARLEGNTVAEYPVYEGDIRLRFRNTSFPIPFQPPEDYALVVDTPQPEITYLQVLTEGEPTFVDGALTRVWIVSDATPDVITERTTAKANEVRGNRNLLLSQCDWTQLPDAPVNVGAWAVYRQELRDITKQGGFPWTVTWPDAP